MIHILDTLTLTYLTSKRTLFKNYKNTQNTHATTSKDYSIRVYNFQVENTADANLSGSLNSKPKIMYHDIAEGSENLKDSSETTNIPWIQPKGLDKDSIGKMPQKPCLTAEKWFSRSL